MEINKNMVEVRKRDNESTGSILRRFGKIMQASKFLMRARSHRYFNPSQSDFQKKREALRRIDWQREQEKLRKMGKTS